MKNSISQTSKVYKDKMKGLIKGMLVHFDIRIVRNSYFESLTQKLQKLDSQNVQHALNQFEIIKNDMITCKPSPTTKIEKFIKRFRENYISVDLIRIGGDSDGGYLIPDIFDRIAYCLSPGVADTADFEVELSRRYGIKSFMIDGSVASAPFADDNFHFTKKFLGHRTNGDFITLSDWMESTLDAGGRGGDNHGMILQMDIEGGEYDVLTFESTATLGRFAAMIIEFHGLGRIFEPNFLYMIEILFEKLYRHFSICHVHPNNCCGFTSLNGIDIPNVIEATFLRHDLIDKFKSASALSLPHPLDRKNVSHKPDIGMPKIWWKP